MGSGAKNSQGIPVIKNYVHATMLRTLHAKQGCRTIHSDKMPLDRRKITKELSLLCGLVIVLSFICTTSAQNVSTTGVQCPGQCTCSYGEKLVNCSNRSLRQIPHHIPNWVSILTFRNNKVTQNEVKGKLFNDLYNLQELILSDNRLNRVNLSIKNAPKVRTLRLDRCSLDEIPDVGANVASNVTTLSLAYNSINALGKRLRAWPALKLLNLSSNKLRHLRNNSFTHQRNLTELYLYRNKIAKIDWCAFAGLNHTLETLSLSRNRIQSLRHLSSSSIRDRPCTGQLSNLRFLDLSRNRISQIDGLTFNGMCRLHTLLLNNNRITSLKDGAFFSLKALVYMKMDYNLIKRVEYSWLYDLQSLQTLSLFRNNISEIAPDSWKFCEKTRNLNLSRNHLTSIPSGRFQRLTHLERLDLSNNEIEVMDNDAFLGLASLTSLDLSYNRISGSVENIEGAFNGLSSLQTLSLRSNKILTLSAAVLRGVESLRELNLMQNNVTSVQNGTFHATPDLRVLRMDSQFFLCDCQLTWFAIWLRNTEENNLTFDGQVRCFHPPDLKGREVAEVDPDHLECGDHPIPALLQQPNRLTSYKGENVTLECSASATLTGGHSEAVHSTAAMSVVWKRQPIGGETVANINQVIAEGGRLRIRNQQRREGGHIFFTSLLLLYDVDYDDDKLYSCVISNAFGTVTSTQERLLVRAIPQVTEAPVDQTVKNGSSVIFSCKASGHPAPNISWQKDGGADFPAAKECRESVDSPNANKCRLLHGEQNTHARAPRLYEMDMDDDDEEEEEEDAADVLAGTRIRGGGLEPHDVHKGAKQQRAKMEPVDVNGPLHFKTVLPRDAGEYRCTAESEVGKRSVSAILTVLYPPMIDEDMPKEMVAAYNTNVVLQCMAQAYPEAKVKWFVNGKMLNHTKRHFLAARNQLLVIVDAQRSDQGTYACEASNELGMQRRQTKLILRDRSEIDGANGSWDIFGPKGIIVVAVFCCIIVTSLVWLIVLCHTRRNPDGAFSTNTETTDLRAVDSSSHGSLDRPPRHHTRSCPNVANSNSRADFPLSRPDLLHATPCLPAAPVDPNMQFRSIPRSCSARADGVFPPARHDMYLRQGATSLRFIGHQCDRSSLSRPPLRALSTSQVHRMQIQPPCSGLPVHNSTQCIVNAALSQNSDAARRHRVAPRSKRRRRRKRATDLDSHESAGGSSSRRTHSSSSDSEECRRLVADMRQTPPGVWQKRAPPRGERARTLEPALPETEALLEATTTPDDIAQNSRTGSQHDLGYTDPLLDDAARGLEAHRH